MGNDPIDAVDLFGLEKLTLGYDIARDGWAPFRVTRVQSLQAIVEDARQKVGKFDPKGKCDNCIQKLRIGGHGRPGSVNDNIPKGIDINGTTFFAYRRAMANPANPRSSDMRNSIESVEQLYALKKLLCEDGNLEFVSCSSFACQEGRDLHADLEGIFGEGHVQGYVYPVKWGLFGTVYQITATKPPLFGDTHKDNMGGQAGKNSRT